MKRATITDVAKLANVSKATVSRVVSDSPLISDKTKKKVRKIIQKLNYVPNSVAQSLTNSSTRIIGIVLNSKDVDPLSNSFFSEILGNISDYLLKNNYYTLYIHSNNQKNEKEYVRFLVESKRVDGLIFLRAYENESIWEYLENIEFPFVIVGTPNKIDKYLWVDNDNIKAGYKITDYLIKKGNNKIAFLGGPKILKVTQFRYDGYKNAILKNNLKIREEYFLESSFNEEQAYKVVKAFIAKNKVDAIVTTDDLFAISAINAIKNLGLKNITVTGFNNSYIRKFGHYDFPTIDINVKKIGTSACDLLISEIEGIKSKYNFEIIDMKIIEK